MSGLKRSAGGRACVATLWYLLRAGEGGTGLLPALPTLCALRHTDVGMFQRLAGIVSESPGWYRSSERERHRGLLSCSSSVVGRAVPPRSGRRLGRSLVKKSVTDLERLLRLAVAGVGEEG